MIDLERLLLLPVAGLFFSLGYKYHQHLVEREEEYDPEEEVTEYNPEEEEYDPEDVTEAYEICSSLFKYL